MAITVYIIESPSPTDFLNGVHEGATLGAALKHAGITSHLYTAVNVQTFFEALRRVLNDARSATSQQVTPILHLSMHGDTVGVGLTSGESLDWKPLGDALVVVNGALQGGLLVSMSTCEGFEGVKMAHREGARPFLALVGPVEEVAWADTVAAFVTYYHHVEVTAGKTASATALMNAVIDRPNPPLFQLKSGLGAQREYTEAQFNAYIAEVDGQLGRLPDPAREGMRGLLGTIRPDQGPGIGGTSPTAGI